VPDITTDLSPEEIQKRLHELLQENLELKGSFYITVL
jgi:ribosomal protein L29